MPAGGIVGAGLSLRLVSSRAPYGRAGVHFEPAPGRSFGVVEIAVEDLLDGAVPELLADPHIDVSVAIPFRGCVPISSVAEFEAEAFSHAFMSPATSQAIMDQVIFGGQPVIDATTDTSTDAGAGAEWAGTTQQSPPASDHNAQTNIDLGSEGDAAAATPATGDAEVGPGLGADDAAHATEPSGDQVTPPVVAPPADAPPADAPPAAPAPRGKRTAPKP